jgi:RNA polymerase sigma-70 factor, ECF subfamily
VRHGAAAVAAHGLKVHQPSALFRPALVNGAAGMVATVAGKPVAVIGSPSLAARSWHST